MKTSNDGHSRVEKIKIRWMSVILALFVAFLSYSVLAHAAETSDPVPVESSEPVTQGATLDEGVDADNTAVNERDRQGDTLTPEDQSNSSSDIDITQSIRQAVMADDALSFTAKNCKIITVDGVVTLRGPVKGEHEKEKIATYAQNAIGAMRVDNQLEVMSDYASPEAQKGE
jgi:hyperosmotically inducible periplasmic protein